MNGQAAKTIRRKASESRNPNKAYKILKQMYIKGDITLLELIRIELS